MKNKSTFGHKAAIVNPETLVGNEIKTLLAERGVAYTEMKLIDSTGEYEGALTEVAGEAAIVTEASEDAFEGLDVAFFCGDGAKNAQWIARREEDDFVAIDLSQPSAVGDEGVTAVAGVNLDAIGPDTSLVISADPVTIPIAVVLSALRKKFRVKLCIASVIEPASQFGQEGVDELFQQTIRTLNIQAIPKKVFERQLAFNLYPLATAGAHEAYVVSQIAQVLGSDVPVAVSITQGAVFHGHSLSIFVQLDGDANERSVADELREGDAIEVVDAEEEAYGTIDAAGGNDVLVGRVSAAGGVKGGFWIWTVVDNLRRSSALNAVLIAESIIERFGAPAN